MKIHVTGNAGSGKTTLATIIGSILDLPVFSLDSVVWKEDWVQTPAKERIKSENELAKGASWVIEGVSSNIRGKADLVVFLDFPRIKCLGRCLKRNSFYLFKSRPELPNNCPEIKVLPKLLKIIWNFPKLAKPVINESIKLGDGIVLSSVSEVERFVSELKHNQRMHMDSKKLCLKNSKAFLNQ